MKWPHLYFGKDYFNVWNHGNHRSRCITQMCYRLRRIGDLDDNLIYNVASVYVPVLRSIQFLYPFAHRTLVTTLATLLSVSSSALSEGQYGQRNSLTIDPACNGRPYSPKWFLLLTMSIILLRSD